LICHGLRYLVQNSRHSATFFYCNKTVIAQNYRHFCLLWNCMVLFCLTGEYF
jgi:hypothetical protein